MLLFFSFFGVFSSCGGYRIYPNQEWCELFSYTFDMKISVPFVVVSQTEDLREVEIKLIAGFIL